MIFGLFVLLIGGISLGFADLRETLTISSDVLITKERFDVHFENQHITQGSVALSQDNQALTIDPTDNDRFSFKITLNNPGDFYEFTIDMANSGNVDAKINEITSGDMSKFIVDTDYPMPAVNDVITSGSRRTLKFRIEYDSTLGGEQNYNFSYKLTYLKKND